MGTYVFGRANAMASTNLLRGLFNTGILTPRQHPKVAEIPILAASITYLLVQLHDITKQADADGQRISFSDNVETGETPNDVTQLIRICRNAAVHSDSARNDVGNNRVSMDMNFTEADIVVSFGEFRFRVWQHGERTLNEAEAIYGIG